jgi:hypothetical protein
MKMEIILTYEQSRFLLGLVKTYKTDPQAIAKLCDEHYDPSGSLLGIVRDFYLLSKDTK